MTTVAMNQEQQTRLQNEVQTELERREWAEPGDNVMAEYVTVLIANGNNRERVLSEMDDLVGSDFDAQFLDWLFDVASDIQQTAEPAAPVPPPRTSVSPVAPQGGSRMLTSALASSRDDTNKRKAEVEREGANKKRVSDQGLPSGPRAMAGSAGRSLQDRMGPRPPMQVRGSARPGMQQGPAGGFNHFRPQPQQQQQLQQQQPMMNPGFGFFPQQHEMMAQMMMMQANMAQMGEMMQKMAEEKEKQPAPIAGYGTENGSKARVKVPQGTKLGSHSVSAINPKPSPGPIPQKPTSKQLCRFSVGCSNSRCTFSHPSPVADEKTGMVLSSEPCEEGKNCKDAECTKSHVSPAAALGDAAGPSRLLCKYQNCTNPACPFRHEDAEGNLVPPPALSAPKKAQPVDPSSDNEDGDVEVVMTSKSLMDGALDDNKSVPSCRYGERCTRADCKFTHPASRPTPKARGSNANARAAVPSTGMNKSKKFGAKLNPVAGDFVPKEGNLEVTS